MSEPKSTTCTRLSEVMGISHDSVNRFLLREAYEPKDLLAEASKLLNLTGGTLNVDDSTLDKPFVHGGRCRFRQSLYARQAASKPTISGYRQCVSPK